MIPFENEVRIACAVLMEKYKPEKIVLFGSLSKGYAHVHSDIDLCVVIPFTDKRSLVMEMQSALSDAMDREVDVVLVAPDDWEKNKNNPATFSGLMQRTGVYLYG